MNKDDRAGAVRTPHILLPQNIDMNKWAVVACDQFTSDKNYWNNLDNYVADVPSTLRLILPECYLDDGDAAERQKQISENMRAYYDGGIFREVNSFVSVKRTFASGKVRSGLIAEIDLNAYDYREGANALIRATEGTVASRLPPRVKIRENSLLELPHIMLLIDDPRNIVFSAVEKSAKTEIYDFELSGGGGKISGYSLNGGDEIIKAFDNLLIDMVSRYGEKLLMLAGDGNHSLAAAKNCYEKAKAEGSDTAELKRYALCEIVNIYDGGIEFEPIHRAVFCSEPDKLIDELSAACIGFTAPCCIYSGGREHKITLPENPIEAIAFVQNFLENNSVAMRGKIDYIHGFDVLRKLGDLPDCVAIPMSPVSKAGFTEYIIHNGILPKKTFSMGHAEEKRYYLEARRIGKQHL